MESVLDFEALLFVPCDALCATSAVTDVASLQFFVIYNITKCVFKFTVVASVAVIHARIFTGFTARFDVVPKSVTLESAEFTGLSRAFFNETFA